MRFLIQSGSIAFGVSFGVAPLVLALLRRKQVLDYPSERSSHVTPTPRGGGAAPAVGALMAVMVASPHPEGRGWALVLVPATFGLVGLVEDVVGIRTLRRLYIQMVAAAAGGLLLLDHLTGSDLWRWLFAVAVTLWLVAFVNAFNFMDGIDGISVAQAVGAGATWSLVGTHADSAVLAIGGAIVVGAALGFAPYNVPRARMFLGDVGSYFIGAWLATLAVLGMRAGVPVEAVLAPLAPYVADTGITLVRRIARGEAWYRPHRDHAYQRLVDAGCSHLQASALVAVCIGTCGALGTVSLGHSLPARVTADIAVAGVIGAYLLSPGWLARNDTVAVG